MRRLALRILSYHTVNIRMFSRVQYAFAPSKLYKTPRGTSAPESEIHGPQISAQFCPVLRSTLPELKQDLEKPAWCSGVSRIGERGVSMLNAAASCCGVPALRDGGGFWHTSLQVRGSWMT